MSAMYSRPSSPAASAIDSIGVVRRESHGIVVDPAWRADGGDVPGREVLVALLGEHGR